MTGMATTVVNDTSLNTSAGNQAALGQQAVFAPSNHFAWQQQPPTPFSLPWQQQHVPMPMNFQASMGMVHVPSAAPNIPQIRLSSSKRQRKEYSNPTCSNPACTGGYNRKFCSSS